MTSQSSNTGAEVQPLPRVLLCGHPRTAEFEIAVRDAASIIPSDAVSRVANLAELRTRLTDREPPDLLVIVQTWSDEICFADFLALPGIGPFSRLICCYGPWCVSDGRNRQDFPLGLRVPVEDFRAALLDEWQQLTGRVPSGAPLPWTAGRDEVFRGRYVGRCSTEGGGSHEPEDPSSATCSRIHVRTADQELSRLWRDAIQAAGLGVAESDSRADGEFVLWDVDVWSDAIAAEWGEMLQLCPTTLIVALTGFATPDLEARLRAAGAARVLSKLLPLEQLTDELARLNLECGPTSQGVAAEKAVMNHRTP